MLSLIAASLLHATTVRAQSDDAETRAREALAEGLNLVNEAEFVAALAKFEEARDLVASPNLLLNISSTLRYLGRNADAARAAEQYLREAPDGDRVEEVKGFIEELDETTARLTVVGIQPGEQIRVDGHELRAPVSTWRIDPGQHLVWARRADAEPALVPVQVEAGEERTVRISFKPNAPKADGTPAPPQIEIITVEASTQPYVGIAVGSLGLVGLGLGGIFGVLAINTDREAEEHCPTPEFCDQVGQSLGEQAEAQALGSTIAFALGGALLATGIIVYLTSPDDPEFDETRVELEARAGLGMVSIGGRW